MLPRLRVLIVDDEPLARDNVRLALANDAEIDVIGECADGESAVDAILAERPDVVFLDVQMPGLGGFDVVAAVGVDRMPVVVFVTAYDEHALRAFEVRALDYLLKPVSPERLRDAIDRARRAAPVPNAARRDALAALVAATPLSRILVHDDVRAHLLPVDAITLARAERNYVVLHTTRGTFRLRGTIGALAARLDATKFLRVNRSDIVRLDAIRELQPWSHGDYRIVLADGSALLWSRRYRARDGAAFEIR